MTEASSRPTRPKQITPNELRTKRGLAGILKSAAVMPAAEARPDDNAETDEHGGGDESSDRADVIDPLPYAEAENVEKGEQRKQSEGDASSEELVVGKALMAGAEHVDRHADEIEHDRRHVEHVVGPVAPAGEESVEVAEDFLSPEVDAAFAGIAVGEFDDRDALRPEEKEKRDDPEPDGDAAVGGDGGDDVEIEDGDDEEQHQIAASEGADQVRLGGGLGRGGQ